MATKIQQCRICKSDKLTTVLDLGEQVLTGIFPKSKDQLVTSGPLQLTKCTGSDDSCGLLQLAHSFDLNEMYGDNYGYRSGLNKSMVAHLQSKVDKILSTVSLDDGDLVIDIGSNDSTTLKFYPNHQLNLVGVDPSGLKFNEYYPEHVTLIADFFPSPQLEEKYPGQKASVITSFSMFYDLEDPFAFMKTVYEVLKEDGIWVFEQSYMPTMLEKNSYDTVCHEHLEYYALKQIVWMANRVGFSIIDVEFNDINGGSFSIVAQKKASIEHADIVNKVIALEIEKGLDTLEPYRAFEERVKKNKEQLISMLAEFKAQGKIVCGLGASTKGNVLLQYCNIDEELIPLMGEVNKDKYGSYTPGTLIPIISEKELLDKNPDYLMVLPWHFAPFFLNSAAMSSRTLLFPLPDIKTVKVD